MFLDAEPDMPIGREKGQRPKGNRKLDFFFTEVFV